MEKNLMRNKILVVDDLDTNRAILGEMFNEQYDILEAVNGKAAIRLLEQNLDSVVIVLLDIVMPKMDGFGFLEYLKIKNLSEFIPVILITSDDSTETEEKGYAFHIFDIIYKPFVPNIIMRRVKNAIEFYEHKKKLESILEMQTNSLVRKSKKLEEQAKKYNATTEFIMDTFGSVVEFRTDESFNHIQRIKNFTHILLSLIKEHYPEYRLTDEMIDLMSRASAIHDIGKIAINDSILLKEGKLTAEEFNTVKLHTTLGSELLKRFHSNSTCDEFYQYCYEICRSHHERWDGKGYPDGLKGDEIPISAQAVSMADVYDALVRSRVYSNPYDHDIAVQMILNGECGVFPPKLIECFKMAHESFRLMQMENKLKELENDYFENE